MKSVRSVVRGVAPHELGPTAREALLSAARTVSKRSTRRLITGQTKAAEIIAGTQVANSYFWATPLGEPAWFEVRRRLEHLHRQDPALATDFVNKTLRETLDPSSIIGLGLHPTSRDAVRDWLQHSLPTSNKKFIKRLRSRPAVGGAFSGVAALLLPDVALSIDQWIVDQYDTPELSHFQVRDSVGYSPTTGAVRPTREAKRRLVIAYAAEDLDQLELLFAGAETGTLIVLTDTFGKASFSDGEETPTWLPPVSIEHVRSRVTRFSQEYIDLHEATRKIARSIVGELSGAFERVRDENTRFLHASVADFLFFQSLKLLAVERLLDDASFDDVVVATDNHIGQEEYTRLLAGVPRLLTDDRVSIVSVSRSARFRQLFWGVLDTLTDPKFEYQRTGMDIPFDVVNRFTDRAAARICDELGEINATGQSPILIVTKNAPAYNKTTADYIAELSTAFRPTVLFIGRNATDLTAALENIGVSPGRALIRFLSIDGADLSPIARMARKVIDLDSLSTSDELARLVVWCAKSGFVRMSEDAIGRPLLESIAVDLWFRRLQESGSAPRAVVVTPNRPPEVALVTTAARAFSIPSIALEPHAQDANYSRYTKVATDFYGVVSNFHRERAPASFGIEIDRVATIGSPRLQVDQQDDPTTHHFKRRQQARRASGFSSGADDVFLLFFGQPSKWDHVERVWTNILRAAAATSSHLLLKPHPEESMSRIADYVDLARNAGVSDRFAVMDDFEAAIAVADIGLTAYSTAAIDAMLRGLPMAIMTDGDVDYPIDMGALIGVPTLRSSDQLTELIDLYRADPAALTNLVAAFAEREPELASGSSGPLHRLIAEVISRGQDGIRAWDSIDDEVLFKGPHPTFEV